MKSIKQMVICTIIAAVATGASAGVQEYLEVCKSQTTAKGACGAISDPNRKVPSPCTGTCTLYTNPNGHCADGGLLCYDPTPGQTVTVTVQPGNCLEVEFPCFCGPTSDPTTFISGKANCS